MNKNSVRWSRAVKVRYVTHAADSLWVLDVKGTPVKVLLELKSMELDLFGSGDWKERKPPEVYYTASRLNYTSPCSSNWDALVAHGPTVARIGEVELGEDALERIKALKADVSSRPIYNLRFERKKTKKKVVTPTPAMRVIRGRR